MLHFINSTVFLPSTSTHNKIYNYKKNISKNLPKTPSFTNLLNNFHEKPKRATVHLQNLSKKSIKQKIYEKTGKKYNQCQKKQLQNAQNKRVFITEKSQSTQKKPLLFVPFQKENIDLQLPGTFVQKPKENRQQVSIFSKKRHHLYNKIQKQKENSFLIKKSDSFVKKEFSLTMKHFSQQKEQLLNERRNLQKEELYYVDELKKEMKRMQEFDQDSNERIPVVIAHFFQSVSKFFKYKELLQPQECKVSVYLGKQMKFKTTLIFDMDETLIHAEPYKRDIHGNSWGQNMQITIDDGTKVMVNLKIRPFVMQVLHRLKQKYQIGVFTAANETYAKQILRKIDPQGEIFDFQLFRQHCDVIDGKLAIKDLRILSNRSIKNIILVDNSPHTYLYQKENAIPIVSFYDDLEDEEMLKLQKFIQKQYLSRRQDVRQVLGKIFKFRKYTNFNSMEELIEMLYY